ncbi:MAG: DNA topoisomerase I [Candidatus Kariarchaeaceae archaeon]
MAATKKTYKKKYKKTRARKTVQPKNSSLPTNFILGIAEKPSAARQLANALSKGPVKNHRYGDLTYLECTRPKPERTLIIAPALGHLFGLESQKGGWTYPDYTCDWIRNDAMKWRKGGIPKKTYKFYLDGIKKLAKLANSFLIMTDYDQEGEVIGGMIVQKLAGMTQYQRKTERMLYSTLQPKEVLKSFENRKKVPLFRLFDAGSSRAVTDWLVGINLSRALTLSVPKSERPGGALSMGRVQGPVLKIIYMREEEIKNHQPEPYWEVKGQAKVESSEEKIPVHAIPKKIIDKKLADKIFQEAKAARVGQIVKIESKKRLISQPPPFNLGSLQSDSSRIFKFSPKKTLQLAEELYLKALISYPRTDSEKYPKELNHVEIILKIEKQTTFEKATLKLVANKWLIPTEGKKTDDAHPAIYPTGTTPGKLTPECFKVYSLIVWRYLATFAPPAEVDKMVVDFLFGGHIFQAEGETLLKAGWFEIYPYAPSIKQPLPRLVMGEKATISRVQLLDKKTKPPNRYSKASILKKMESLNLGTKATRADIIETLFYRKYVMGRAITITELGVDVLKIMAKRCPEVISVEFTRSLEDQLEEIKDGKRTAEKHREEVEKLLTPILAEFPRTMERTTKDAKGSSAEAPEKFQVIGECLCRKGNIRVVINPRTSKRFASCSTYGKKDACGTTFPLPQQGKIEKVSTCEFDGWPVIKVTTNRGPWQLCLNPSCPGKNK